MSNEMMKTAIAQANQQPQPAISDPNVDAMLQSLLLDDTDVKRILKGEIQELLNQLRQCLAQLTSTSLECYKTKMVDMEQGKEILFQIQEANVAMARIEIQLARYHHMVPYLLLSSPLVSLSNITQRQEEAYCRKVGIMIGRDKLMSAWDEASYETHNFYDSIQILIELRFHEAREGWKAKIVTEEKKNIVTEIRDKTGSQRKKWHGLI
jgi:hypothetical protein